MKAAEEALEKCASLFPHLQKQKHFIQRRFRNEYNSSDYVDRRKNNQDGDVSMDRQRRYPQKSFNNYNRRNLPDQNSSVKS